ncbi:F0F1 ATP synthase subunit B [Pseudogulbenkiania sp. NH8B]|uniref:F0F1 ATP synthase subunit delta n=1 Tax=Pseudogulbenkiania sp. (strain NH8B) TaxID=748280 RepID=UPI00022798F1|nr:F0F1 ATP synthase subunit delta [Pseudogulbenkiania sp. NH8B]BAK77283.1 F0F1 ATP synthase subunit B [Pseudogulbenkiania sp. NH8B]
MGLDATTFILEIVNFLVLLWLLTRFLYRPLQAAIAARQQQNEQAYQALQTGRAELEAQQTQLAARHAELESQRDSARSQLANEIDAERAKRLTELSAELASERAKAEVRLAAWQARQAQQQDEEAAQRAEAFLRGYLTRLAGPELEHAIVGLFLADLAALPEESRRPLQASALTTVELASAYEMTAAQRAQVENALTTLLTFTPQFDWQRDPALIAGLAVRLDGHLLEASLAKSLDGLRATATAPNPGGTP